MRRFPGRVGSRRMAVHAGVVVGLVFAAYIVAVAAGQKGSLAFDIVAYWRVDLADPYSGAVGDLGFFPYAPPIALLLAPFTQLPWILFVAGWYVLLVCALVWLGRRNSLVLLAFPPIAIDLYHGNIHLLLAGAIVLGFRYPAAWAFVLLTKVTPGIGLLWFAARREWRALALALAATGALVLATVLLLPAQWLAWLAMLSQSAGVQPPWPAMPIPLWLRLPAAAALVWWGARRDARWVVPTSAALALPALWPGGLAIVAAAWVLRSRPGTVADDHSARSLGSGGYHAPDARERAGADTQPAPA